MSSGYQAFLIANTRVGLERDLEPWLLPNDAYPDLEDCYLWRGRVKKRLGYNLLGRLQRTIGTTDGAGNLTVTLLNIPITSALSQFVVGSTTYTDPGGASPVNLLVNGSGTATLDRATGVLTITGGPLNTAVIYRPGLPVMGLRSLNTTTIEIGALIGFDTRFSYIYNNASNAFLDLSIYKTSSAPFVWHGTNSDFFWSTNYQRAMFTTNYVAGLNGQTISGITAAASAVITVAAGTSFVIGDVVFVNQVAGMVEINGLSGNVTNVVGNNVTVNINSTAFSAYVSGGVLFNLTRNISSGDGIKWLDQDQSGWVNFAPPLNGSGASTNYLQGALLIAAYKGRLIMLNTLEGTFSGTTQTFAQRARWCQVGTPYYSAPLPTNYQGGLSAEAWRDDIVGRGGFLDAPTLEQIISAQFVKDTLIVYFERSTWRLSYTGNELLPFAWEKINTELGAESTFSIVPFDLNAIAIGNTGIHSCDTVNVQRIDQKIPDEVFKIQNANQGAERVYGIRDYYNQLVYWSMPYIGDQPPPPQGIIYPNKILVYNYIDQSYSFFNDSFTCFGYYQSVNDLLWQDASMTWGEATFSWVSAQSQSSFPIVVGGNQQGFVEVLMQDSFNQDSLFISNVITGAITTTINSPNHNLQVGDFVKMLSVPGITGLTGNIYKIVEIPGSDSFVVNQATSGTYTGAGTMTPVNNITILTKRFNPFMGEASQTRLGYADLYFDTTENGQVTVNLYIDEDSTTPINSGNNTVNTFPETTYQISPDTGLVPSKIWKRIYFEDVSQLFQLEITMNDTEMTTESIVSSEITLHGMVLWFSKSGRLINV
jgi:hypothetical protein